MSNWIPRDTPRDELTDDALSEIQRMATTGYVGRVIADRKRSQFFVDDNGVLKFYNSVTEVISTVDLTT